MQAKTAALLFSTLLSLSAGLQAQPAAAPAPDVMQDGAMHRHDIYLGVGFPGLASLGYAYSLNDRWDLRGEYGGGLSVSQNGNTDGVNVNGNLKASRSGLFADWHPFSGSFRLVGGVTANDIEADLAAVGSGTATINGIPVNMAGQYLNVTIRYPNTTPYLGIGWGHQKDSGKGLGFYSDLGVMFGSFGLDVSTSLVGQQGITQSDINAQTQKMRDSLSQLSVLPSLSLGLSYRY